jgi:hypothetical protein
MACGAVMHLVQVHPADSTLGPGFEHNTFECSGCHDIERRLVFNAPGAARMPLHEAPPTSGDGGHTDADYALLKNAWDMLRGWRKGN